MAITYTYTVSDADLRRAAHRLRSGQISEAFWDERKHLRWPKGIPTGGEFKAMVGIGGPRLPVGDTKLKQESPLQRIIALLGHKTGLWASHFDRECARGGADPKLDLKKWKRQHPEVADEPYFVYTSRVVAGLDERRKHEMIFQLRETPEPVPYIAEGMIRWRNSHGLPQPDIEINSVRAPLDKANAVGKAFALTPDQAHDPRVQAAFADFARQNDEMWSFATRSEAEGGLGIKVTFSLSPDEPYQSAAEQADDLRINRHITTQSGLGGKHTLLTRYQYDRFRAVHDIFGHAAIGGGFDRHGEYQAWLAHMSMYVPPGASAMASEYHGVNSNMWVQTAETVGTGRSVLLPKTLTGNPWNRDGSLKLSAQGVAGPIPELTEAQRRRLREWMREAGWEQVTHRKPRERLQWVMRGDDGRFGRGSRKNISGTHRFKRGPAIAQQVARHGGITYQPATNRTPKRGYAVAIPGAQQKIDRHTFNADDVEAFIDEHKAWFKNPHVYLGIWDDGDQMWMELSEVHPNSSSALRVGKARGEIAVFDLAKGEDVHVEPNLKNVRSKPASLLTPEQYAAAADKLMAQAKTDAPAFLDDVQAAADANNGQLTDVARQNAVKVNRDRIIEKMGKKDGMPPSDILRSTILVDDPEGSLDGILASFRERGYQVWVDPVTGREDITNRYADGSIGYKDVAVKLVKGDDDTLVKELLILSPKMSEAKYELGGHELYETIRARSHLALSLEEKNALHALELQMNELYQKAEMDENVTRYLHRSVKARPELRQRVQEALRERNSRQLDASSLNWASDTSRPSITANAGAYGLPFHVEAVKPPSDDSTTFTGTLSSHTKYRGYVGSAKGTPHRTASIANAKRGRRS